MEKFVAILFAYSFDSGQKYVEHAILPDNYIIRAKIIETINYGEVALKVSFYVKETSLEKSREIISLFLRPKYSFSEAIYQGLLSGGLGREIEQDMIHEINISWREIMFDILNDDRRYIDLLSYANKVLKPKLLATLGRFIMNFPREADIKVYI